jgi:hypothetical protein
MTASPAEIDDTQGDLGPTRHPTTGDQVNTMMTFDALTRELGDTLTRRSALRGLVAAAAAVTAGGAVLTHDVAGTRRKGRKNKEKNKGKGKGKTTICHNGQTIKVSRRARKAHLKHGDQKGPCPAPLTCGTGGPCHVFVTSTTHTGDFGGLAAADEICQQQAQAANLPGTYKAWLSDSTSSPNTRFVKSPGPYQLVDGTRVADNYADLTDHALDALIDRTEFGQAVTMPFQCWTYTDSNGSAYGGSDHCSNWTSTSGEGHYGMTITTSHNWSNWNSNPCSQAYRLYCFQQS